MVRSWVIAAVAFVGLLVTGCAGSPDVAAPADKGGPKEARQRPVKEYPLEATGQSEPEPLVRASRRQAGFFFPSQSPSSINAYMMAEAEGKLFVDDGCVRLEGATGGAGDVVVWPPGYSLDRRGNEVLVLNGRGEVEARVGDEVRMGGGQITKDALAEKPEAQRRIFEEERRRYRVPEQCRGPLWVAAPGVRVLRQE